MRNSNGKNAEETLGITGRWIIVSLIIDALEPRLMLVTRPRTRTLLFIRFLIFLHELSSDGRFVIAFVVVRGTVGRTGRPTDLHLNFGQTILHLPLLPIEFGTEEGVFRF